MYHLRRKRRFLSACSVMVLAAFASGCSSIDRLKNIGEQPALTSIETPPAQPGYKPVQMPMPKPQPASYSPNSLWRNGSGGVFKDQRGAQVGDLLQGALNF